VFEQKVEYTIVSQRGCSEIGLTAFCLYARSNYQLGIEVGSNSACGHEAVITSVILRKTQHRKAKGLVAA